MLEAIDPKWCPGCEEFKGRSGFYKNKARHDGLENYCKPCAKARKTPEGEKARYIRRTQKEKISIASKICSTCKELKTDSEFHRNIQSVHGLTSACKGCYAIKSRLKLYGVTESEWQKMLTDQDHKCLICQQESEGFHVDHDHETGRVRGALCASCNLGLGKFKDNVNSLRRAIMMIEGAI